MAIELPTVADWFGKDSKEDKQELIAIETALGNVHQAKTVQARFDALATLIEACTQVNPSDANFSETDSLRVKATELAISLVDTDEENNLFKKIAGSIEGPIKLALEKVYAADSHVERFDALADLIDECSQFDKAHPDYESAQAIRNIALQSAMQTVDAENESVLFDKIAERNQYKAFEPNYMPWNIELPRVEEWLGEDIDITDEVLANDIIAKSLKNIYDATTIYDRFDALANLIDQCAQAAENDPNYSKIQELKKTATKIAAAIVDAKDETDVVKKIADRKKLKAIDQEYMPWHEPPTRAPITAAKDRKTYVKESMRHMVKNIHEQRYNWVNAEDAVSDLANEENPVTYLKEMKDRETFRIFPSGGKLKVFRLNPLNFRLAVAPFDTKIYQAHGNPNQAIFVVSPKGDMFANVTIDHEFFHSSFLAAGATFYAGTMSVADGKLKFFDAWSGHYKPNSNKVLQMLSFIRKANLLKDKALMGTIGIAEANKTATEASLPKIDSGQLQNWVLATLDKQYFLEETKKHIAKQYIITTEAKNNPEVLLNRLFELQSFDRFISQLSINATTASSSYSAVTLGKIDSIIKRAYDYVGATNKLDYFHVELLKAIDSGNKEIINILLDSGLKKIFLRDANQINTGGILLYRAVENNNPEIVKLLLDHHAFPSFVNPETKDTPLLTALKKGNIPIAKLLIEHKADIRQAGKDGHTPLMIAINKKLSSVVNALLKAKTIKFDEYPYLCIAVNAGASEEMVNALLTAGVKINQAYQGFTPLMYAVQTSNINLAKLLIAKGANVNEQGPSSVTALLLAADSGDRNMVKLLLNANADPTIKASSFDGNQETPKDAARKAGHKDVYQIFLDHEKPATKINNDIAKLEVRSKGLLGDLQKIAINKLNVLAADNATSQMAADFLTIYQKLEQLAKTFIIFSPHLFNDTVILPENIHQAIFNTYQQINVATEVKTAEKSLNHLIQVIKDCHKDVLNEATQKPLANLIDTALKEVQQIAKPSHR